MPDQKRRFYLVALTSFAIALLIAIYPLSTGYSGLRPEFVCLLVIYWLISAPQYFGVFFSWMIGMAQDLIEGIVWGGHALALSIVAYICMVAYQRIKSYSLWHQTLWVFVLVGFHQVTVNWIQGLAGYRATPADLILSTIVSALFWPPLYLGMGRLRLRYRVH